MALLGFSRVNTAVFELMRDSFNDYLRLVNEAASQDLTEVKECIRGLQDPFNLSRYPSMMVYPGDGIPDVYSMSEVNIDGKVNVLLVLSEANASGKIDYYADALMALWRENQSLGGVAMSSTPGNIEFLYDEGDQAALALMFAEINYRIYV